METDFSLVSTVLIWATRPYVGSCQEELLIDQLQNCFRRPSAGTRPTQGSNHFRQSGPDSFATRLVTQQFERGAGNVFGRGGVLDEFRVNRLVGEQVGH